MGKEYTLEFRAGETAFKKIRENGFCPEQIGTLAGASGGAKWLILSQLDRVVIESVLPRLVGPVYTIGTSIGGWRFACYAQKDPLAAIERFEEAYLSQTYSDKPDRHEITAKSIEILDEILGKTGAEDVLSHPVLRTNIMTVRSRGALAFESPAALAPALFLAATSNAISRRSLGWYFERALFYDARDLPPFFNISEFPMRRIPLTPDNVKSAVLATGSIPLVLSGVSDIDGAPPGVYRDGGVIDYHLDIPQSDNGRLSLYLHFINRIIPGWFDKAISGRSASPDNVRSTVLICPSESFVASLPNGKIPDRRDFRTYDPDTRERNWRIVVDRCREMADELRDVLENDRMAERLTPL